MYPFPVDPGNKLFIEGEVKFEGTSGLRPDPQDFGVSVNISGVNVALTSGEEVVSMERSQYPLAPVRFH